MSQLESYLVLILLDLLPELRVLNDQLRHLLSQILVRPLDLYLFLQVGILSLAELLNGRIELANLLSLLKLLGMMPLSFILEQREPFLLCLLQRMRRMGCVSGHQSVAKRRQMS